MARITASLRLSGEDLEPDEASLRLGMQPDRACRKGEAHFGKNGRRYSDHSAGLWSVGSQLDENVPLTDHLQALLKLAERFGDRLREFQDRGFAADLFVGVFDIEGNYLLRLEPNLLAEINRFGLDLVIDVYE